MTLGIIILGIMTRSPIMPGIVSLDIMTLSMVALGMMALGIMVLGIMKFGIMNLDYGKEYNNTSYDDK